MKPNYYVRLFKQKSALAVARLMRRRGYTLEQALAALYNRVGA